MINLIKKKYYFINNKYSFDPKILGVFFNPFYFARKGLIESIRKCSTHINGNILDVGCGAKPYKNIFKYNNYIGLEYDTPNNRMNKNAEFFYDGNKFPFGDGEFDSVLTNQVLEHVFNPDNFLKEINRVLKDDKHLLLTVPFVWDEHEQPYDYARYSSFGLKHLLNKNGFEVVISIKSVNDIRVIFQMLNMYIFKTFFTGNGYINFLLMLAFITPINVIGQLAAFLLPKNNDLYLDNIILCKKLKL